jgi:hypothetical protein
LIWVIRDKNLDICEHIPSQICDVSVSENQSKQLLDAGGYGKTKLLGQ